jgi:hypothetical protein
MAGEAFAMSQSRGKSTGLGGGAGGAGATGGVMAAGDATVAAAIGDVEVVGVFGGNGRVTGGSQS